jgi:copper(I)-binding protein
VSRSRRAVTPIGRLAAAAAIAGLAVGVSACEAGNNAPTLEFHPQSAGLDAVVDGVKIINAFVLGWASGPVPAGQSAGVFLAMYNEGRSAERLTGVSAPTVAKSVTVPPGGIALPPSQAVYLTGPVPKIVLTGLLHPLEAGRSIHLVLSFTNAGSVTLILPVLPRSDYYSTFSPAPPPSPSPSVTPGKHAGTGSPSPGTSTTPSSSGSPSPSS